METGDRINSSAAKPSNAASSNPQTKAAPKATPLNIPTPAPISAEAQGRGQRLLDRVAREVGPMQFERYFDGQARLEVSDNSVEVTVPSGFLAEMLSRRFGEQIKRAAIEETKPARPAQAPLEVRFRVDRSAFDRPVPRPVGSVLPHNQHQTNKHVAPKPTDAGHAASPANPAAPHAPSTRPAAESALGGVTPISLPARPASRHASSVRHRFDTFVTGASNKLAAAAAMRMADEDGVQPTLFVHGPSGVGKSHLLHALAARFQERRTTAVVRIISAEAFTNEFVTAIKTAKVDAFRRSYRRVDLLCLDDVHFLSGKEATQNELLYTFDTIGLDGARIAMASDEHPRDIRKLSERLVSRFMAGAVVKVDLPDAALRETLFRRFAERRGMSLEEGAIKLLVERSALAAGAMGGSAGSVREIEGLLNQVDATQRIMPELSSSTEGRIGAVLVRRALGLDAPATGPHGATYSTPLVPASQQPAPAPGAPTVQRPRRPITVEHVVAEVCRSLCVDLADFMGKGRHKRVVLARSLVSTLSRRLTTMSFPEIARAMGRTNHSTVITAQKRIDKDIAREDGGVIEPGLIPGYSGTCTRALAQELAEQIVRNAQRP